MNMIQFWCIKFKVVVMEEGTKIALPQTILNDMLLFMKSIDNAKDYQRVEDAYSIRGTGGDL